MTGNCKFILLNTLLLMFNIFLSVSAYELNAPWYLVLLDNSIIVYQIWTLTLIETPRYTVTTTQLTSKDVL